MNDTTLSTTVLIPTYRRAEPLANCVASILANSFLPCEILVVGREGDEELERAIVVLQEASRSGVLIRATWVGTPGHIPPIETGVRVALGELVAIVDDDVVATPEWLSSLVPHFSDSTVGVVGGRVLVPGAPLPKTKGNPGCVSWYGKHWGNLGSVDGSGALEVNSVMEGNCIWRRDLLASLQFDPILNFDDAAMYGLDLCLQAHEKGFRVLYEPRALVYHHVAPRSPELDRADRAKRVFSYCRNYTYIMLKRLSLWRIPIFLSWWFGIGERGAWGLGALLADTMQRGWQKDRQLAHSLGGKLEGIRLWLKQ